MATSIVVDNSCTILVVQGHLRFCTMKVVNDVIADVPQKDQKTISPMKVILDKNETKFHNINHQNCGFIDLLPHPILLHVISKLDLPSIGRLSCTCKFLASNVTNYNEFWKFYFNKYCLPYVREDSQNIFSNYRECVRNYFLQKQEVGNLICGREKGWEDVKAICNPKVCQYIFFCYSEESKPDRYIYIHWCPEGATIKQKMLSASLHQSLLKVITKEIGNFHKIQATDFNELQEEFDSFVIKQ